MRQTMSGSNAPARRKGAADLPAGSPLASPEVRRLLVDFVSRRVSRDDAEDVVQTVLCEALAAPVIPGEREELRRWLVGIARHKVADFHRRSAREKVVDPPEPEAPPPPLEARSLAGWAEKQVAGNHDGARTLAWMAREGEGEKLESIAADERLPAERVRQRVSRLRRFMKQRWLAELAAAAALAVAAIVAWSVLRGRDAPEAVLPLPEAPPRPDDALERARALRGDALERCRAAAYRECLDGLDRARELDAAGDRDPAVQAAREQARRALEPPPLPSATDARDAPPAPTPAPRPRLAPSEPVPTGKSTPGKAPARPTKGKPTSFESAK
jgi:DNA-directed RNA polymerase specialized sigma24 family protein